MAYVVPSRTDTVEDQRLYTQARLVEVECGACAAVVQVKKNSEHHTSIQWTADAVAQCRQFARLAEEPGGRKVHAPCPRLADSIEQAVREGAVTIGAEDGW
jgi:hypothetical protein